MVAESISSPHPHFVLLSRSCNASVSASPSLLNMGGAGPSDGDKAIRSTTDANLLLQRNAPSRRASPVEGGRLGDRIRPRFDGREERPHQGTDLFSHQRHQGPDLAGGLAL